MTIKLDSSSFERFHLGIEEQQYPLSLFLIGIDVVLVSVLEHVIGVKTLTSQ